MMLQLILTLAVVMAIHASLWFVLALLVRRNDIADIAWGLGFMVMALYLWVMYSPGPLAILVYLLVALWALRLSWHIFRRLRGKPEDFRYRQWRESWGKTFYWRSWIQVFLLQAFLALIIALPMVVTVSTPEAPISFWNVPGIMIWWLGYGMQVIADRQLATFVRTRSDKAQILQTGLWRYSRHPNYFGEILMWWGLFLIVLPLPLGWVSVISPLTITGLLVFVSGVPMLEARYKDHPEYAKYRERTPALLPWFPKKQGK